MKWKVAWDKLLRRIIIKRSLILSEGLLYF
jgi:hypothetical protein